MIAGRGGGRDMFYDVVIVGAGVAGCTAAAMYGRAGLRVALIEKHRNPATFKVLCGHFIQGGTRPTLERLGLWDLMVAEGAGVGTVGTWSRFGWMRPDDGWPTPICFRRERLDPLLRRWAARTPGVDLLLGETVVGLIEREDRVAGVRTICDGIEREYRADLVIGADGNRSTVARLGGVAEDVAPNERFAMWAYYRDVTLRGEGYHQVWRMEVDCAFAVRCDDGLTLLVAYPHKDRLPAFELGRVAALESFLRGLPDGPDLSRATRATKLIGTKDYPCVRRDPAPRPGLLLVGDAALTGDPLPAVGCGWAFRSAEWMADATIPALLGHASMETAVARYLEAHRFIEEHDALGREEARGLPMDPRQSALRAAATADREVAHRLYLFGMRMIPVSTLWDPSFVDRVRTVAGGVMAPAAS